MSRKSPVRRRRSPLEEPPTDDELARDPHAQAHVLGDVTHCREVVQYANEQKAMMEQFTQVLNEFVPKGSRVLPWSTEVSHMVKSVQLPRENLDLSKYREAVKQRFPQAILRENLSKNTDVWRVPYRVGYKSWVSPILSACSTAFLVLLLVVLLGGVLWLIRDLFWALLDDLHL